MELSRNGPQVTKMLTTPRKAVTNDWTSSNGNKDKISLINDSQFIRGVELLRDWRSLWALPEKRWERKINILLLQNWLTVIKRNEA